MGEPPCLKTGGQHSPSSYHTHLVHNIHLNSILTALSVIITAAVGWREVERWKLFFSHVQTALQYTAVGHLPLPAAVLL